MKNAAFLSRDNLAAPIRKTHNRPFKGLNEKIYFVAKVRKKTVNNKKNRGNYGNKNENYQPGGRHRPRGSPPHRPGVRGGCGLRHAQRRGLQRRHGQPLARLLRLRAYPRRFPGHRRAQEAGRGGRPAQRVGHLAADGRQSRGLPLAAAIGPAPPQPGLGRESPLPGGAGHAPQAVAPGSAAAARGVEDGQGADRHRGAGLGAPAAH